MENTVKRITIETTVNAAIDKVWTYWNSPDHIIKWSNASDDWHTPYAENNLQKGGKFLSRMEAKDGKMGFDFGGTYDEVIDNERVAYTLDDGRKVTVVFSSQGNETKIVESFDPEQTNPVEMQKAGWQSILNNFKTYTESN